MKVEQKKFTKDSGWKDLLKAGIKKDAQLVLVFGGTTLIKSKKQYTTIKSFYPNANIIMCSTAGEIVGTRVSDNTLALTALQFQKTDLQFAETEITNASKSSNAGKKLATMLEKKNLKHVLVFSDGLNVNGTTLVEGLVTNLPKNVSVTGGLVGDGARFKQTLVGFNGPGKSGKIVVVGLYGSTIQVGYGSLGGWDPFGPKRTITKAKDNVLFELDNQPALELYKKYLGDRAKDLPGSGLLFPLKVMLGEGRKKVEVVRTILNIDEKKQSMIFAGTMPEGSQAQLMKANFDRLIDGAEGAAGMSKVSLKKKSPDVAILVSCIGRKLVLKERVDEEVEAVQKALGKKTALIGFYSYGEISPVSPTEKQCRLHNQTMTITTLRE